MRPTILESMDDARLARIRKLAIVPRWGIVPTIRQQSVLEHSGQVVAIALWLVAKTGASQRVLGSDLMMYALCHDELEALTGDLPSTVKSPIITTELKRLCDEYDEEYTPDEEVKIIVKAADLLEQMLWLHEEIAMGNRRVLQVYEGVTDRFELAWDKVPWDSPRSPKGGKPSSQEIYQLLLNAVNFI